MGYFSALLKRRIHKTITNFGIGEGSYVVLKEYHLAKAKKLVGGGTAMYIIEGCFSCWYTHLMVLQIHRHR